jgi:hypothetical protein
MGDTLLTDEIRDRIAANYARGVPLRLAVEAAGIEWDTAKVWRRRGKRGEEPYAAYHRALVMARARLAAALIEDVRTAGERDGRAAMWLLEKRFPGFYASKNDGKQPTTPQHGAILVYPVALPVGADASTFSLPQGHAFEQAIDTEGEEEETDDE